MQIPTDTLISTDLRNLILWLLQKDPNVRPSVKDILNEVSSTAKKEFTLNPREKISSFA